jgi:hypothetical protein
MLCTFGLFCWLSYGSWTRGRDEKFAAGECLKILAGLVLPRNSDNAHQAIQALERHGILCLNTPDDDPKKEDRTGSRPLRCLLIDYSRGSQIGFTLLLTLGGIYASWTRFDKNLSSTGSAWLIWPFLLLLAASVLLVASLLAVLGEINGRKDGKTKVTSKWKAFWSCLRRRSSAE